MQIVLAILLQTQPSCVRPTIVEVELMEIHAFDEVATGFRFKGRELGVNELTASILRSKIYDIVTMCTKNKPCSALNHDYIHGIIK